jgi:predicted N-acyltransferase
MKVRFIDNIHLISADAWHNLVGTDYPFLRHEFLAALEESHSVGGQSGWQPMHLVVESDDGRLLAAMPLYLKNHSYGEYVFDWSWAEAYQNHGLDYYPKLLAAIPFTPATGPTTG